MQDTEERAARRAAAVASAVVPALLIAGLLRLPLPGREMRARPHGDTVDVVFLRREVEAARRRSPATSTPPRNESASAIDVTGAPAGRSREARAIEAESSGWPAGGAPDAPRHAVLDLTVRDPAPLQPRARDAQEWLERKRVMDPRTTRFEKAWVPAGNALEQARFRSPAVNAALGLFGGPPRRCSEVERRLRVADCLPLDADDGEAEALRRTID